MPPPGEWTEDRFQALASGVLICNQLQSNLSVPLTVFDTKGIPANRKERIEAAVEAGGKHIKDPYGAWISTDLFRGYRRMAEDASQSDPGICDWRLDAKRAEFRCPDLRLLRRRPPPLRRGDEKRFTPAVREKLYRQFRGLESAICPFVNLPEAHSGVLGGNRAISLKAWLLSQMESINDQAHRPQMGVWTKPNPSATLISDITIISDN